jgi:hypothetical protein
MSALREGAVRFADARVPGCFEVGCTPSPWATAAADASYSQVGLMLVGIVRLLLRPQGGERRVTRCVPTSDQAASSRITLSPTTRVRSARSANFRGAIR